MRHGTGAEKNNFQKTWKNQENSGRYQKICSIQLISLQSSAIGIRANFQPPPWHQLRTLMPVLQPILTIKPVYEKHYTKNKTVHAHSNIHETLDGPAKTDYLFLVNLAITTITPQQCCRSGGSLGGGATLLQALGGCAPLLL